MIKKEIELALDKVKSVYGLEHAKRLEQLFRNETAHFKSGNFGVTLSPGMEATKDEFPYGWTSLLQFWTVNPNYAPTGVFKKVENTSLLAKSRGVRTFITFENCIASFMSVAHLIKLRGNNFGSWFSKNEVQKKKYNDELDKIKVRIVK